MNEGIRRRWSVGFVERFSSLLLAKRADVSWSRRQRDETDEWLSKPVPDWLMSWHLQHVDAHSGFLSVIGGIDTDLCLRGRSFKYVSNYVACSR